MARTPRITRAMVEEALHRHKGRVFQMARALGCTSRWVQELLLKWPDLGAEALEYRGELVDVAEQGLAAKVDEGNIAAIIFVLKTLGRDRGYSERMIVTPEAVERLRVIIEGGANL